MLEFFIIGTIASIAFPIYMICQYRKEEKNLYKDDQYY